MARRRPELPGQERHRAGPPAPPNPPAPCRPTHPRACCAASPPARLPALTGQWVSRRADAETCLQAGRPLTEGGRPRLPARVKGSSPHRQLPVPPKEARPAPCAAHSLRGPLPARALCSPLPCTAAPGAHACGVGYSVCHTRARGVQHAPERRLLPSSTIQSVERRGALCPRVQHPSHTSEAYIHHQALSLEHVPGCHIYMKPI